MLAAIQLLQGAYIPTLYQIQEQISWECSFLYVQKEVFGSLTDQSLQKE